MRKQIILIMIILAISIILIGCGEKAIVEGEVVSDGEVVGEGEFTFEATIMETGDTLLIAPEEESNEYNSSDKISVNLTGVSLMNEDGKEISQEDLVVGDRIKVTYNGAILESYPAQISASEIRVVEANIILSGYLALIDDIYQMDSGLNYDIDMIAFDTTGWKDISEGEMSYLFSKVKDTYGADVVEGTFEELSEQGLIDKENLIFEKGILIKISNVEYKKDNNKITCSIEKWRSGLGAIGSDDVTATFDGVKWAIKSEGMWIS